VVLENVSSDPRDVLLGHGTGKGPMYSLKFLAMEPDGKEREGFNLSLFTPIAGLMIPIVAHLEPGASRELSFPLAHILCIAKPKDITLDTFAKLQYPIRVLFEGSAIGGTATKNPWVGKLTSASIRFAN
jgi:hypothetical protein